MILSFFVDMNTENNSLDALLEAREPKDDDEKT